MTEMNNSMKEIVRCFGTAHGRVQGVGFRFFVQQTAKEMGLTGWVKNMPDGTVDMEVQGNLDEIDAFSKRIKKGGGFIKVERLDMESRDVVLDEHNFVITY